MTQFKAQPIKELPTVTGKLGGWYCGVLFVHRIKYLLLVNEVTLAPLLLPARGIGTVQELSWRLKQQMVRGFTFWGISEQAFMPEVELVDEIVIAKTASRSILGSMNDIIFRTTFHADYHQIAPDSLEMLELLGKTPMGGQKYASAIKMLHMVLEGQK